MQGAVLGFKHSVFYPDFRQGKSTIQLFIQCRTKIFQYFSSLFLDALKVSEMRKGIG